MTFTKKTKDASKDSSQVIFAYGFDKAGFQCPSKPVAGLRTDAVLQIGVVRGCCLCFWIYVALVPLCFVVGRALFIPGDKSVSVLSLLITYSQD